MMTQNILDKMLEGINEQSNFWYNTLEVADKGEHFVFRFHARNDYIDKYFPKEHLNEYLEDNDRQATEEELADFLIEYFLLESPIHHD